MSHGPESFQDEVVRRLTSVQKHVYTVEVGGKRVQVRAGLVHNMNPERLLALGINPETLDPQSLVFAVAVVEEDGSFLGAVQLSKDILENTIEEGRINWAKRAEIAASLLLSQFEVSSITSK